MAGYLGQKPTPSPLTTSDLGDGIVTAAKLAPGVGDADTTRLEYNQAILAFKLAAQNSLAKFSMVDQVIDEYQDATGIDASASTNELAGGATTAKYYHGGVAGSDPTGGDTNGTYTLDGVSYEWRAFTTTGSQNLVMGNGGSLDIMLIAGGGGGGADQHVREGGGGGAGGLKYYVGRTVAAGTHAVVVGTGGSGGTDAADKGDNGVATTFTASGVAALSATAGGGGGSRNGSVKDGNAGGSGGGGGQRDNSVANYGTGVTNEGYRGGSGYEGSGHSGGGGGGASSAGIDSPSTGVGGSGGAGVVEGTTSVYDWEAGSSTVLKINGVGSSYAGGGAGSGDSSSGTATHGGGNPGSTGSANTGGGGGANSGSTVGYAGGTGIAIIRYVVGSFTSSGSNLTLQSQATTAESAPTKADLVLLIEDNEGTATINTDIKAKVSRDGSAFTGYVTFTDEGNWGTNKRILVARQVDISGITSGTSMKYKIETFNQSAGVKETRIHATSLAWS
jgi:hypothetical protein